jgi:hypothetical protein
MVSQKSSDGIETWLRAERRRNRVSTPGRARDCSLLHSLGTASRAHPAFYTRYNGQWVLFSRGQSGMDMKLTTHLHLVPTLRTVELYLHSPIHLHGMKLYFLTTGKTLPFVIFYRQYLSNKITNLKNKYISNHAAAKIFFRVANLMMLDLRGGLIVDLYKPILISLGNF